MKKIVFILILSLFSCKTSKETTIYHIERNFNDYIINEWKSSKENNLRFLYNEGKFINEARKEFLQKINIDLNSNFNIVETYHMFSSDSYYRSAIKKGPKVYYFKKGYEGESKLELITLKEFKKEYSSFFCLLFEADNNIEKLTGKKIGDATFHFSIHIIKKTNGKVKNYSSQNLCFWDKNNEPQY